MADTNEISAQPRDRSPAYPNIPLQAALARLSEFESHFKRSAARPGKVGDAWGISAKAYADRVVAALRYYGLLDYQGAGTGRAVVVSDEGRKYLRAQQEQTKREVAKAAALRPKQIAKFWKDWGGDRPADAACIDELVLKNGFSERGARKFLQVYDATIAFAGLADSDKIIIEQEEEEEETGDTTEDEAGDVEPPAASRKPKVIPPPPSLPDQNRKGILMEGERELTAGLLSKGASFRLIVSGKVGEKEIERLIKKLELDKEILADESETVAEPSVPGDAP